jgi:hypothetical protein
MSEVFLLDSSFFINGWTKRYRPQVFSGVWKHVDRKIEEGVVVSCDEVLLEINQGEDDLVMWAKQRRKIFLKPTGAVLKILREVMDKFPNFAAQGGSKNSADPFVVAHAKARNATVVTDEINSVSRATKPPKIPAVCEATVLRGKLASRPAMQLNRRLCQWKGPFKGRLVGIRHS